MESIINDSFPNVSAGAAHDILNLNDDFNKNGTESSLKHYKDMIRQYSNENLDEIEKLNTVSDIGASLRNLKVKNSDAIDVVAVSRIKHLEEELATTKAEKEFVWSLWRQLQLTKPYITNVISDVVRREKQMAEQKENKLLEKTQLSEEKLAILMKINQKQNDDLTKSNDKLKLVQTKLQSKEEEISYLNLSIKTCEDKLQMYEQMTRDYSDKLDRIQREHEIERQRLVKKIKSFVKLEIEWKEKKLAENIEFKQQRNSIDMLNTQLKQSCTNYDCLLSEFNEFRESISKNLKEENEKLANELNDKAKANQMLSEELKEINCRLEKYSNHISDREKTIEQLKSIQLDLQKEIEKQKESLQVEINRLRLLYNESLARNETLEKKVAQLLDELKQYQVEYSEKLRLHEQKLTEQTCEIERLKNEEKLKEEQLKLKELRIGELNWKLKTLFKKNSSYSKVRTIRNH
jgi:hypothetical protein